MCSSRAAEAGSFRARCGSDNLGGKDVRTRPDFAMEPRSVRIWGTEQAWGCEHGSFLMEGGGGSKSRCNGRS